ncbi:MAG: hypothetical protein KBT11_08950 [Treponema sp.]|nr:hypothetical protein [Candidatus Treponema equifaecale]
MTVEKINESIKIELKKKKLFSEVSETELTFVDNCSELTEEQLGDNTKAWFDGETIIDNVEEIEDGIQQVFAYTKEGDCVNLELYFLNNGGRENDFDKLMMAIQNLEDREEFSEESTKEEADKSYKSMVENSVASLEVSELVDNTRESEESIKPETAENEILMDEDTETRCKDGNDFGCTNEVLNLLNGKIIYNRSFESSRSYEIGEYLAECEKSCNEGWMKFKEIFSPVLIEKHPLGAAAWLLNETDLKHYKSLKATNPYDVDFLKTIAAEAVSMVKGNF